MATSESTKCSGDQERIGAERCRGGSETLSFLIQLGRGRGIDFDTRKKKTERPFQRVKNSYHMSTAGEDFIV